MRSDIRETALEVALRGASGPHRSEVKMISRVCQPLAHSIRVGEKLRADGPNAACMHVMPVQHEVLEAVENIVDITCIVQWILVENDQVCACFPPKIV
jgi:hypothetical protein